MKSRLAVSLSSGRRLRLGGLVRLLAVCLVFAVVPPIASGAPSGDPWSAVTDLSAIGQSASVPQIALSSDGTRATVVWYRFNGSNWIVQSASATISAGTASWGAVTDLSAAGRDARIPQVALSSDGTRATAIWLRSNGTHNIVQSASVVLPGVGGGGGGGGETRVVVVPRGAYCSVSGNTWISGRAMTPNTFLNLEWEQILVDGHYFKATPAIFVVGTGLTCDPPPAGMKRDGYATGFYNVPAGIYALYHP